jgi:hypothetical protein
MAHKTSVVPVARLDHLMMSHVGDEVLVYDQTTHAIHRLNAITHLVWTLCDGSRTVPGISQEVEAALRAETSEAVVRLALSQLAGAQLLDSALPADMRQPRSSRRVMLQRMAIAGGVALPALVSVSAPASATHGSCHALGSSCTLDSHCCSGVCSTGCPDAPTPPTCRRAGGPIAC